VLGRGNDPKAPLHAKHSWNVVVLVLIQGDVGEDHHWAFYQCGPNEHFTPILGRTSPSKSNDHLELSFAQSALTIARDLRWPSLASHIPALGQRFDIPCAGQSDARRLVKLQRAPTV
jgi:hypothetical protein